MNNERSLPQALNTVVPSLNVREMGLVRNLVGYVASCDLRDSTACVGLFAQLCLAFPRYLCKVSVDVSKTLSCSGVLKKYFPSEQAPTEAAVGVTLDRASFAGNPC